MRRQQGGRHGRRRDGRQHPDRAGRPVCAGQVAEVLETTLNDAQLDRLDTILTGFAWHTSRHMMLCGPDGDALDLRLGSCRVLAEAGLGTPALLHAWRDDQLAAGRSGRTIVLHPEREEPDPLRVEVLKSGYILVVFLEPKESWEIHGRKFVHGIGALERIISG